MEQKKREEAYKEKPENLKDVFEFDKNNLKEDVNKEVNKDIAQKTKKKDDEIMDRFDAFADGLI
jgi:hypothetical protein